MVATIKKEGDIVISTPVGIVTYDSIVKESEAARKLTEGDSYFCELVDFSQVERIQVTAAQTSDFVRKVAPAMVQGRPSAIAVYAPTEATYQVARIFLGFSEVHQSPTQGIIFKDREKAVSYITETARQFQETASQ